jgi:hypothetical protein
VVFFCQKFRAEAVAALCGMAFHSAETVALREGIKKFVPMLSQGDE